MVSVILAVALAADGTNVTDSIARMQASIEKQRVSVRRQAPATTSSFFTTGWLTPKQGDAVDPVAAPCEAVGGDQLQKLVTDAAVQEGVNPLLLRAMILRESAGRACAVSSKGAEGLMQLMPATSAELGVRDPFDAAENVYAGARYIRQLLGRYNGDLRLALAAYNAGMQRVDDLRDVPPFAETQAYVTAILSELKAGE